RMIYNQERPHEGIGTQTPGERCHASPLAFPAQLPPIEYGSDDIVRKAHLGGWISFKGRDFGVSKALQGLPIALRPQPQKDGCFDLFFCHQKFDSLDLASNDTED
ncbi:MAG: transposase, partial [Candidatus Accumulibacter sp.]|nr:transposase [Accumulibacter sp.]